MTNVLLNYKLQQNIEITENAVIQKLLRSGLDIIDDMKKHTQMPQYHKGKKILNH